MTQFNNWPKVRDIRSAQCYCCGCLLKWEMVFRGYAEYPVFYQDDNATTAVNNCPKCNGRLTLDRVVQNPKETK